MVTPNGLLPVSSVRQAGVALGPFLLDFRRRQLPELTGEQTEVTINRATDTVSEKLNAELPNVSCRLDAARTALTEKRIDDLCAQLQQASALLQELIVALIPDATSESSEPSEAAIASETHEQVEESLVMAVAA